MDGIDIALIETDGDAAVKFGPSGDYPYNEEQRILIEQGLHDATSIGDDRNDRPGSLTTLEHQLTLLHADAVHDFLERNQISADSVDVIGFHGQTVLHRPQQALTVQLGDGALLADKTGIDVVFDMRAADVAAGGQGAPLVPAYHRALAALPSLDWDRNSPVVFVNVGGISNITYISASGELIAFDTGPGNNLIDQWMHAEADVPYDLDGEAASRGVVDIDILKRYLAKPYFQKPLPKSLDRSDFEPLTPGELAVEDGARTLARLTAETINAAIAQLPEVPSKWVICGGGRKNGVIMQDLHDLATETGGSVVAAELAGFNGDATEAQAFAYLAVRSLVNLPLTFPGTTGCLKETFGGVLASTSESSSGKRMKFG